MLPGFVLQPLIVGAVWPLADIVRGRAVKPVDYTADPPALWWFVNTFRGVILVAIGWGLLLFLTGLAHPFVFLTGPAAYLAWTAWRIVRAVRTLLS
jgi:hypothetical protein